MNRRQQKELARTGKPIIKLHTLGAAGGVTGSLYLIEIFERDKVTRGLLDAGLYVEAPQLDFQNRLPKGLSAKDIDFIVVSHLHLDHSGLVPKLVKDGFTGPIYCTPATLDLMEIVLPDSGFLQEEAARRFNQRRARQVASRHGNREQGAHAGTNSRTGKLGGKTRGKQDHRGGKSAGVNPLHGTAGGAEPVAVRHPLYTEEEARASLKNVKTIEYRVRTRLADNVFVTFTDAGHVLGSAVVTLEMGSGSHKRSLCFTGNIGRENPPLLNTLEPIKGADYVITESTYGNRRHLVRDRHERLAEIINKAYERAKVHGKTTGAGVILIPAFAIGRAQVLLDDLRQVIAKGMIPNLQVYLDGRMSIKATEVHRKYAALFNKETRAAIAAGIDPFTTPRFALCREWPDSAKLQEAQSEPIIIVGSSGMAAGGRIVSHLAKRLPHRENTVVFVGYQGTGTLGNALVRFAEGNPFEFRKTDADLKSQKTVNVQGKPTRVRATVEFMSDYSGHGDYEDILKWFGRFTQKPKTTFVVHGDDEALAGLRDHITRRLRWNVVIPKSREVFELS